MVFIDRPTINMAVVDSMTGYYGYLIPQLDKVCGLSTTDRLVRDYKLSWCNGKAVLWRVNQHSLPLEATVMDYDADGRYRGMHQLDMRHYFTWPTMFGQHLLAEPSNIRKNVALCQNEMTALLASALCADKFVWMALGYGSDLTRCHLEQVIDRRVFLFPEDAEQQEWWTGIAEDYRDRYVKVVDTLAQYSGKPTDYLKQELINNRLNNNGQQ